MVEVITDNRRFAEGSPVLVVIPDIKHSFLLRILSDLLIQLRPLL